MSVILFFIILAVLVLSHEFGHFIFAKKSGLRVDEFGFGFPPRVASFKKGETIYSFNLIPFGGFVKIFGENGENKEDKRSFGGQKIWIRALIIFAGVLFNWLLAWPILTAVFFIGAPVSIDNYGIAGGTLSEKGVMIIQVQEKTPAEKAGLKEGDFLLRMSSAGANESLDVSKITGVQDFISKNAGKEIKIDYLRGGSENSVVAIPAINPEAGKGSLGIAMDNMGILKLPLHRAAWEGLKSNFKATSAIIQGIFLFFSDLFGKREMIGQVTGPIGIAGLVGNAAQMGFVFVLQLAALLSIYLAIINLLPLPALDGGHLMFLAIEAIKRKPLSQNVVNIAHSIGFAILILLMLVVTYKDILNL